MNSEAKVSSQKVETLWNKNYLILLCGQWVSQIGTYAYLVALPLVVLKLTGSTTLLGVVTAASLVPFTILGPFAGVLVDKMDRKKIIVLCDLFSGVTVLFLSFIAFRGNLTTSALVISAVLCSVFNGFFSPAVMASVPNLVPNNQLTRAMSLMDTASHVSLVLGPVIGGAIITYLGFPVAFLINGVSFLISGISEIFMSIPQSSRGHILFFFEELKVGWRFMTQKRALMVTIIVVMLVNFFEPAVIPIIMPVIAESMEIGAVGYGTIRAVYAGGSLAAVLILTITKEQKNKGKLIAFGLVCIGASFILMSGVNTFILMLSLVAIYGIVAGITNTLVLVVIQNMLPDEFRGRIFGLVATISAALMPISFVCIGGLLSWISWGWVLAISGIATILGGIGYYFAPKTQKD